MMECPFCESGHIPTKKVFMPLVDPKNGMHTGEFVAMSSGLYLQVMKIAATMPKKRKRTRVKRGK